MIILNLGAGGKLRKDSINIDITPYDGIDKCVDLSLFPWPWANNSVDGIHASHVIEHFPDQKRFINECHRILKPGGFLRLCVPHSSSVTAVGCMGHYRTYSYGTLKDYLSRDFYMFKVKKFETVEQKLNWWYEETDAQGELPLLIFWAVRFINPIMNFLIRLSPRIFENVWCYWVGGAREVVWSGVRI